MRFCRNYHRSFSYNTGIDTGLRYREKLCGLYMDCKTVTYVDCAFCQGGQRVHRGCISKLHALQFTSGSNALSRPPSPPLEIPAGRANSDLASGLSWYWTQCNQFSHQFTFCLMSWTSPYYRGLGFASCASTPTPLRIQCRPTRWIMGIGTVATTSPE